LSESTSRLAEQFDNLEQQTQAATLGMWTFLITEVLFFGGLFTAYTEYRVRHPDVFAHASNHLYVSLGVINTGVLILSSFTMALAIHFAHLNRKRALILSLLGTMFLGAVFLGIKGTEYYLEYQEHLVPGVSFKYEGSPDAVLFFSFYFVMTGAHALHMIIGEGILATMVILSWLNRFSSEYYSPVEVSGLYWHFVDIVWIFLFPLLYLVGRHL
jgi:cytochrome c oxidase subunit 3